jgi:uncharacterized phage protein (TIGR02218 family)
MTGKELLINHFQSGATTVCHAWSVVRKDGQSYGFTDHDNDLVFEGITFKASTGLTAGAMQRGLGLSVDNTEVSGALSDDGITEIDISAGRFDAAAVTTWWVNWANPEERAIRFKGHFGEIQRSSGAFKVELRGLADALSVARGRTYQPNCTAILGDSECRFNLGQPGFTLEASVQAIEEKGHYVFKGQPDISGGWFEGGKAVVLSGRASGIKGVVKLDQEIDGQRHLTLWVDFDLAPQVGDLIRFEAGCDKLASTCRSKFGNFFNFRGFPHVPGTDWVTSYPTSNQRNDGGSRQK